MGRSVTSNSTQMRQESQIPLDFLIVSPKLTIEAMRDSGYKDTDHALAELIDNSVEAGASLIEIIAVETPPDGSQPYARARITKIAVVDDGEGMDATTLRRALKFGDGTRKDRRKRGIGRFGVGLPQSSISQCQRVDIWTWQNGADNALHCYLDLQEIKATGRQDVPEPTHYPVPDDSRQAALNTSESSGTLVVWSMLDRVQWRGGAKTLEHTASLCGRVYRKFLADHEAPLRIELILATEEADMLRIKHEEHCVPNDPLYLVTPSSTPPPFADRPMFRLFSERAWTVPVGNHQGRIHVRCTMARPDAINEAKSSVTWPKPYPNPGSSPWGKHANRNKGVSIVRARRELEMSLAWVNNYEPEERWWSVEVEFDPILDEIFGVVNNKQHAHAFVAGAGLDWKDIADPGESFGALRERLAETSDPRSSLLDVWIWMDQQIKRMRIERAKIRKGSRTPRHPQTDETLEDVATVVINEQRDKGETGDSDRAPPASEDEKIQQLVESAKRVRVRPEVAKEWAEEVVRSGRRVLMKAVPLGHQLAFFGVEAVSDVIEVWINDQHPAYRHLIEVLASAGDDESRDQLVKRLQTATFALRMLLIAWARHEDKAPPEIKELLEETRMDWGREARKFLSVIES